MQEFESNGERITCTVSEGVDVLFLNGRKIFKDFAGTVADDAPARAQ